MREGELEVMLRIGRRLRRTETKLTEYMKPYLRDFDEAVTEEERKDASISVLIRALVVMEVRDWIISTEVSAGLNKIYDGEGAIPVLDLTPLVPLIEKLVEEIE